MKNIFKSEYFNVWKDKKTDTNKMIVADYNFKELNISIFINLEPNQIISLCRPPFDSKGNTTDINSGRAINEIAEKFLSNSEVKTYTIEISCDEFYSMLHKISLLEEFLEKVQKHGDYDIINHVINSIKK